MSAPGTTAREGTEVRLPGLGGRSSALSAGLRFELSLQRAIGFLLSPLLYIAVCLWMRLARGYRIHELTEARGRFRELSRRSPGPLIVCANHLTLIDSFVVTWGLSSLGGYLRDFRRFPWNFPERRNFYRRFSWRLLCYLGQCIAVVREGPRDDTRKLLEKMRHLLRKGNTLMIFPEGTRSRSGRIDAASCTYGVGQILAECPEAQVLCVYLRGDSQAQFSDFPAKCERFAIQMELLRPRSPHQGLRAARDISQQIISKLVELEDSYFDSRRV